MYVPKFQVYSNCRVYGGFGGNVVVVVGNEVVVSANALTFPFSKLILCLEVLRACTYSPRVEE